MVIHQILHNLLYYGGGQMVVQGLGFVRGFLVARLLGPTDTGYLSMWGLIYTYGVLTQLGFQDGMYKQVTLARGAGKMQEAQTIRDSSAWSVLACASVYFLAFCGFCIWNRSTLSPMEVFGILGISMTVILYHFYNLQATLSRIHFDFRSISIAHILLVLTELILIILLLKNFRIYGAVLASVLAYLVPIVYLLYVKKETFHFSWRWQAAFQSWRAGFPLLLASSMYTFLITLDRVFVAKNLSATEMGYYSMAITIATFMPVFPTALASILYVKMLERYGKNQDILVLKTIFEKATLVISIFSAFLIVLYYPFFEGFLHHWLPLYQPSIPLAAILLCGAYSISLSHIAYNILVTVNRHHWILVVQGCHLVLSLFLYGFVLWKDWGLWGFSCMSALWQTLYACSLITLVVRHYEHGVFPRFFGVARYYFPLLYSLVLFGFSFSWTAGEWQSSMLWREAWRILLNLAAFLPILAWLYKTTLRPYLHP